MTTPNGPGGFGDSAAGDPLPEATTLVRGAAEAGHQLKILGGLGVSDLCTGLPPRLRAGQDIELACMGKSRRKVADYLESAGCEPDKRFNNLNGDRQMYFNAPSGRPVDVMVDRLSMCHTLEFKSSFGSSSITLDPADLLLSKLQIIELNEKDARDLLHLLSGVPVSGSGADPGSGGPGRGDAGPGGGPGRGDSGPGGSRVSIDSERFGKLLGADWGWWRTVTGNLRKLPALADEHPELIPPDPPLDPIAQSRYLLEMAESARKRVKWLLRAHVGDRVRLYEQPDV